MADTRDRGEAVEKLKRLIKDVKFAMLTTVDTDGSLRSRPMVTQKTEFDGDLWFFTRADAHKVDEIEHVHQVNVSYMNPDDNQYVSVSGTAHLVRDPKKMEELWNPVYRAWFPDGLDDPNLALLKVTAEKAEYWEAGSGVMVQIAGFVKALATGERHSGEGVENEKINLKAGSL